MNINRFSLFIVPSLLCGHANVMHAQAEKGEQKKNVLFLIMDDMRTELNCYGAKYMKTPNMDALASQGVLLPVSRTFQIRLPKPTVMHPNRSGQCRIS